MGGGTPWPDEFRDRAVKTYLERRSRMSLRAIAYELDVPVQTLRRWVKEDVGGGRLAEAAAPAMLNKDDARELARLRKENADLREEVVILKKAAAFFAKETGSNRPRRSSS